MIRVVRVSPGCLVLARIHLHPDSSDDDRDRDRRPRHVTTENTEQDKAATNNTDNTDQAE